MAKDSAKAEKSQSLELGPPVAETQGCRIPATGRRRGIGVSGSELFGAAALQARARGGFVGFTALGSVGCLLRRQVGITLREKVSGINTRQVKN